MGMSTYSIGGLNTLEASQEEQKQSELIMERKQKRQLESERLHLQFYAGIQFKNPMSTAIINHGLGGKVTQLEFFEEKYQSFDLPENFTLEEYKELDEFYERIKK